MGSDKMCSSQQWEKEGYKMLYHVQCFAGLGELIGQAVATVEAHGSTISVAELKGIMAVRYPHAAQAILRAFMAVNQQYAADDHMIVPQDELALIPPVSGGDGTSAVSAETGARSNDDRFVLMYNSIAVEAVSSAVAHPDHGAALLFIGTTREHTNGKRTIQLDYEAYVPMALKMLQSIGEEIAARWPGTLTAITHRLGTVPVGEASVVIAVSSPHRASCYDASRYAIERLKQRVPIWKKEIWEDGSKWVGHQLGAELWNPMTEPYQPK